VGTRRVPIRDLSSGVISLPKEAAHYLLHVLRLSDGDSFVAFDPEESTEANATLVVEKGATFAKVELLRAVPELPDIFWVHGLPKGDKADAIIRDATELGVTSFCFAVCERSVPKLDVAKVKRWQKISDEASRQCGRTQAAEVRIERNFADALLWATANAGRDAAGFCFHPEAGRRFESSAAVGTLVFAAGPEGGLTEREVAQAEKEGLRICSLGDRVLRTETVPAAVLGAVLLGR
jgi:16S rRNA (uracil1498-N3)-methyltransferase